MPSSFHKHPLPNKYHDVVDDITQLAETFQCIDRDLIQLDKNADAALQNIDANKEFLITSEVSLNDCRIRDIAAKQFVVFNEEGTGLTCVEGGGAIGGTTGQSSIKASNDDFDIVYADVFNTSKNATTTKINSSDGISGQCHLFSEEEDGDERFLGRNAINQQVPDNFELQPNESVILKNEIDPLYESDELATKLNYGLIKIGTNISCADGVISRKKVQTATKNRAGIVQLGSGINIENGIISPAGATPATHEKFGTVKLGNGFEINENGELELQDMADASIIYKLSQAGLVSNGLINLEEKTLIYKAFVTKDMVFTIHPNFEAVDDFTFVLELISDGLHLIHFADKIMPISQTMPVNRGVTKLYFSKKLGMPYYEVAINRLDAPEPILLTPANETVINSNFQMTVPQGCSWYPATQVLRDYYDGYCDCKEIQFKFETLVCVDYVKYWSRYDSYPMGEFILKGSNDGINWTTLLYRNEEIIYGRIYTDVKGCFRYFNLKIGYTQNENKPAGVTLWGTQIDNNESEITCVTPYMASAETSFAKITASNVAGEDIRNATNEYSNSFVNLSPDDNGENWIKYELTEPAVVNVLRYFLNSRYRDQQASWFKLEASNDDENWVLLLERQYIGTSFVPDNGSELFFDLDNETAYKYFKFTRIASNNDNQYWPFYGFKLYYRSKGKHCYYRGHPYLNSENQDGYEVSASSEYNGDHAAKFAFDNDANTKWAASSGANEWIQLKLPAAQAFNGVQITSRGDGWPNQAPSAFKVQGSNDGEEWNDLFETSGIGWTSTAQAQVFNFENEQEYNFYRLFGIQAAGGSTLGIGGLEFGRFQQEPEGYLEKIENIVPLMSSNSQNGFVASASSIWSESADAYKAFNRAVNGSADNWQSSTQTDANCNCSDTWVQIQLPAPACCNRFVLKPREDYSSCKPRTPKSFNIEGSNDGKNWMVLLKVTDGGGYDTAKFWNIENSGNYSFYRINIFSTYEANQFVSVGELEFLNVSTTREY